MVTETKAHAIALEMPEGVASSHHGTPDFRVNKKIYATIHAGKGIMVLKLPREEQLALADADPDIFDISDGWAKHGWTKVQLKLLTVARLRPLVRMAWENVAPKKLIKEKGGEK